LGAQVVQSRFPVTTPSSDNAQDGPTGRNDEGTRPPRGPQGAASPSGHGSGAPPSVAALVFCASLAGGLGELALRTVLRSIAPRFDNSFYLNPEAIWMGGLANLPLFALVGAAAWWTARILDRPRPWVWALGAVSWLAAMEWALISRRIHLAAQVIAAAGVATIVVRAAAAMPHRIRSLARAGSVLLALIAAGGALALHWRTDRLERAQVAALPDAPANAPNVLLLILDTVRASELSVYGYGRRTTPVLEQLAARGMRFDRAIATAPWTLPSHASMFTGRYPFELTVGYDVPLTDEAPTLAGVLGAAGYRTGGFVANTVYGSYLHGLNRGFQRYRDYPLSVSEVLGASTLNRVLFKVWNAARHDYAEPGVKDADRINGEFLGWLDGVEARRPWFAFLNYFDGHMAYDPPAPYDRTFLDREPPTRSIYGETRRQRSADEVRGLQDAYDGAIAFLDAQLGELFAELERRGQLHRTAIIVTADHGEAFAEHGFLDHGASLYLPELHVPLIVRLPGDEGRGCVVKEWVTLRDLAATIADIVPLEGGRFPGTSLLRHCRAGAPVGGAAPAGEASPVISSIDARTHLPAWYPAASGAMRSLHSGAFAYIEREAGAAELYDVDQDPRQQVNLARDPRYAEDRERLARALQAAHGVRSQGR
jgi:arylsulfatase A-like enzyme